MRRGLPGSAVLARLIVRAASALVPRRRRAEWTAEWHGELCYLAQSASREPAALRFSLGAVQDGFWIRIDGMLPRAQSLVRRGSAGRCGLSLTAWAAAGLLLCLCLPGARDVVLPQPYRHADDLVIISAAGYSGTQVAGIPFNDYDEWTADTRRLFSQVAFYLPEIKGIHLAHHPRARLSIALASQNLLRVLELPSRLDTGGQRSSAPRLIISNSAWRKYFSADARLIGRHADIDGAPVLIAGVLPDRDWRLPGAMDALLLESPRDLAKLPPHAKGFVLARIRGSAFPPPRDGWRSMVECRDGDILHFDCISVDQLVAQPRSVFFFILLLACVAVPATTALPLGDYPLRPGRLPLALAARRWAFLAAKFLLVMTAVFLFSMDLAYGLHSFAWTTALYLQMATAFPALLLSFRWILQDQRRRCPVCLRRLSNPARVGQASCNFLAWNGTELICVSGHGLLHIPELPTSWFSSQRWLSLDSSWLCLFPDSCAAPTG